MKKIIYSFVLAIMIIGCNSPVEFENLKHTALGKAKLKINQKLEISNFGKTGNDGVSVELGQPKLWAANISIKEIDNSEIILNVLGSTTSEEKMHSLSKMILRPTSNKTDVRAVFPTPTNDLFLSLNDSLIYSSLNFPRDSIIIVASVLGHEIGSSFSQIAQNGACYWGLVMNESNLTVATEEGTRFGNKLVISEHIPNNGSIGRMIFEKMNITAKNIELMTIHSEKVEN